MTEAQIKLQLAEEEDNDARKGNLSLHEVTPSGMLSELLEIEDLQYVAPVIQTSRVLTPLTAQTTLATEVRAIFQHRQPHAQGGDLGEEEPAPSSSAQHAAGSSCLHAVCTRAGSGLSAAGAPSCYRRNLFYFANTPADGRCLIYRSYPLSSTWAGSRDTAATTPPRGNRPSGTAATVFTFQSYTLAARSLHVRR